jgi:flagellar biosynthesis/type III secretory pathway protein FliH
MFRRVAWDYGVLAGEHRKLKQAMEELQPAPRPRAQLDEAAHSLLAAAHRAARELLESAREECEQALRKAKRRAAEIEDEAARTTTGAASVLETASTLRASLQEALRRLENGEPLADPVPAHVAPPAIETFGASVEPLDLAGVSAAADGVPVADDPARP